MPYCQSLVNGEERKSGGVTRRTLAVVGGRKLQYSVNQNYWYALLPMFSKR